MAGKVSKDQAMTTLENAIKMIQAVKAAIEKDAVGPSGKGTLENEEQVGIMATGGLAVGGKGGKEGCKPC